MITNLISCNHKLDSHYMILLILFPVIVKAEFICLSLENGFLLSQKMPEAPTIDLIYKKIK